MTMEPLKKEFGKTTNSNKGGTRRTQAFAASKADGQPQAADHPRVGLRVAQQKPALNSCSS